MRLLAPSSDNPGTSLNNKSLSRYVYIYICIMQPRVAYIYIYSIALDKCDKICRPRTVPTADLEQPGTLETFPASMMPVTSGSISRSPWSHSCISGLTTHNNHPIPTSPVN